MICECNLKPVFSGNEATIYEQKHLQEIKIDAGKWKTLYRCRSCSAYWEEVYKDGRFGGTPELKKVDINYVKLNWNI